MIGKLLKNKKAEGYIDVIIGVFIVLMVLVITLNIFTFVTMKTHMDRIADVLIETATYSGEFGEQFYKRVEELQEKYFDFEVEVKADAWYNMQYQQVQLGDGMSITIRTHSTVSGINAVIPMNLSVSRSGTSEQYWRLDDPGYDDPDYESPDIMRYALDSEAMVFHEMTCGTLTGIPKGSLSYTSMPSSDCLMFGYSACTTCNPHVCESQDGVEHFNQIYHWGTCHCGEKAGINEHFWVYQESDNTYYCSGCLAAKRNDRIYCRKCSENITSNSHLNNCAHSNTEEDSGDLLDNAWPIEWNTKEVVGNSSLDYSGTNFVRVSSLTPTATELAASQVSAIHDGSTIVLSYAGGQSVDGAEGAMYADGSTDIMLISIPTAGTYGGINVPEPGLYVVNLGHEDMGGVDADIVFAKAGPVYDDSLPIEWNTLGVAGNATATILDYALVKVSNLTPNINELSETALVASFGGELISMPAEIMSMYGFDFVVYGGQCITVPVPVAGEYPELGVAFSEAGLYVLDLGKLAGVSADCKITVLKKPDAPPAPSVVSITDNSITLNVIEGCEYSMDGINWQDDTTFSNLEKGKKYTFYARYKATNEYLASDSASTVVFTGYRDLIVTYGSSLEMIGYTDSTTNLVIPETFYYEKTDTWYKVVGISNSRNVAGSEPFRDCTNLVSVTIPDSVQHIGYNSFLGCTNLESVYFGENSRLTEIGYYAFGGCTSLTNIDIPDSVLSIGTSAFDGCSSLTSFEIPYGIAEIGLAAFANCNSLTSIEIPSSVTTLEAAFQHCTNLESVYFGENSRLTEIGLGAFAGCTSLTNIDIPDSVLSIGMNAFNGCSSFNSIVIPDGVTTIDMYAFMDCHNLSELVIPGSVTKISDFAFANCYKLTSITFNGTKSQWNTVEYNVSGNWNIKKVICIDGEVSLS